MRVAVRADGSRVLRSLASPGPVPRSINDALWRGAATHPSRAFVAERGRTRDDVAWSTLAYGDALARARAIAQGLLDAGASPQRPVAIATDNGIAHALVTLAAHEIGVPTIPLARIREDAAGNPHARALRDLIRRLTPAIAFADDETTARRLRDIVPDAEIFTDVSSLERTPSETVASRARAVDAATIAKIMLTSGTTGAPKGVLVTHGMIVSNQVAFSQIWPHVDREPPVLVDWLPWSHAFGGNKVFNFALHRGGTLYVDDGAPTARDGARTLEHLRTIAPTAYFNVPRGYALLVDALEADAALRATFFSRLRLAFCAAAALPAALAERFERARARATSRAIPLACGWGLTETAPGATCVHEFGASARAIGVPLPGVEIKLASVDGGDELRVRGPNVTPGYALDDDATRAAFDEEGFFRSGDVASLVDANDADRGLVFGGRVAENFKLSNGAWVRTAALRDAVLATAPFVEEVLLLGDDADEVCAILFVSPASARETDLRERVAGALSCVAATATGRGERIARALVARDRPDPATGEITAKGTLNRAVARDRRAAEIARLYAARPSDDPDIVVLPA